MFYDVDLDVAGLAPGYNDIVLAKLPAEVSARAGTNQ